MISQEEMQFYASKLAQQSQIPAGVSLTPFLADSPPSTTHDAHRSPVGPLKYFTAVDGYISHLLARTRPSHHDPSHPHPHSFAPSHSRPNSDYRRSTSANSITTSESATDTETDVDGETDDEPTIRAPHSTASSETMSLHSNGDADSIYTDDSRSEMGDEGYGHSHANGYR